MRDPVARSMAWPTAGGGGIRTILVPLPHTEDPVAVLLAEVGDVRAGGLEDPQAQQTEHGHQREIVRVRRFSCCGEQRLELQVGEPQVGDSAGTMGRRTCSAGECSRISSRTQVR
jgi:hypothetical protein